ncbi:patatin family protein (plasmid) [Photobacterium sp. DA100]|uniref:patatin-like phospholipase family protein n=1 Tax=Photobacterium sp. DA100 TaxID=3027472 RepID=UPI00247B0CFE|nr:patatin family protein [Photobacterium sp. DA100]WEM44127.1 patatin family protein [Photobacterium sp. DA100]
MIIEGTIGTKSALVVEGGAMRGIFAAGVLDHFLDIGHRPFDFCIGVSAGSTNLAAWLANQPGRSHRVITDYSCRKQFIDFTRFIRGGHWLDLDWLWEVTIDEIPIDGWELEQQSIPLFVVTTNVENGEPHYIQATEQNLNQLLKASCAVPLAYRDFPQMDGYEMTDGGVADSIPVIKAYEMGARDITVVLSRPQGYRKKSPSSAWLVRKLLGEKKHLVQAMLERAERYNRAIDFISNPPDDCNIKVINPPDNFEVGRVTTDSRKLQRGYEQGIAAAKVMTPS